MKLKVRVLAAALAAAAAAAGTACRTAAPQGVPQTSQAAVQSDSAAAEDEGLSQPSAAPETAAARDSGASAAAAPGRELPAAPDEANPGDDRDTDDLREYAHGVSVVENPVSGKSWFIWSDSYDCGTGEDGSWTHDVFWQAFDPADPALAAKRTLIAADEAQEPASASVAGDGNMIVTFEDGSDNGDAQLSQRYAIYDARGGVVLAYPQTIFMGGHSGHAASTRDRHVVFWSNEWVDDGAGENGLGTGKDVYVTSMRTDGSGLQTLPVSAGGEERDWWPVLAASDSRALLVWQRYVPGQTWARLCCAVYDPVRNRLVGGVRVLPGVKTDYYNYSACWLEGQGCFALLTTQADGTGSILLVDESGAVTARADGLPPFVRESAPAVTARADGTAGLCCPTAPTGALFVTVDGGTITPGQACPAAYRWTGCGTAGFFKDSGTACFVTLGTDRRHLLEFSDR